MQAVSYHDMAQLLSPEIVEQGAEILRPLVEVAWKAVRYFYGASKSAGFQTNFLNTMPQTLRKYALV